MPGPSRKGRPCTALADSLGVKIGRRNSLHRRALQYSVCGEISGAHSEI